MSNINKNKRVASNTKYSLEGIIRKCKNILISIMELDGRSGKRKNIKTRVIKTRHLIVSVSIYLVKTLPHSDMDRS